MIFMDIDSTGEAGEQGCDSPAVKKRGADK